MKFEDLEKILEDACKKDEEGPTKTANMLMDVLLPNAEPSRALMFMNPKDKKMIIMMEDNNGDVIFDSDYCDFGGEYYKQLENFFRKEIEEKEKEEATE